MTFDVRLQTPFNCIINGPSGSGKTTFVRNLLKLKNEMFASPPKKVFFYYMLNQDMYLQMENEGLVSEMISTLQTFPTYDEVTNKVHAYKNDGGSLVIFDDIMTQITPDFERMFCNLSHHQNASIILLSQNLFYRAKEYRTISLNTHYMVLMKSPRDATQIGILSKQICPNNSRFIVSAYQDATKRPYSYLLLDFKPETPPSLKLRTDIFPHEFPVKTYLER